jgi:cation/acetate symporter
MTARASSGQITGHGSIALSMFAVIVFITIAVSFWAARHVRSAHDFYTAGSRISGLQNGLAISGDFMSASTFLGVVGLVFAGNGEAVIYIASPILGLVLLMLYVAEPLRNLGRYTVTEVISLRFEDRAIRVFCALSTLTVTLFYLIAQMVGAAALLQILVGIPNSAAVVLVAGLMMLYVLLGGMLAATWVQIIKAVLLVGCVLLLSAIALGHVGFDLPRLYELASHQILATQGASGGSSALASPFSALSLGVAMSFGMAGLPHLLIRFFTVPNAVEARRSVLTAAFIIAGVFLLMVFVLAYAAIAFVQNRPELLDAKGQLQGGANMAVIHLSGVLGGEVLLGVVAAVTFATILAVVAGLTMAGAGALANDLHVQVLRGGSVDDAAQVRSFRVATVLVTVAAVAFGIVFEGQSIAYMVSLAFAVAASANFPVLILAIYWKGLTRRGLLMGGSVGLIGSVLLIVAGPAIWVGVLGHPRPLFPYAYPALASMPLAFLTAWMVSRFDPQYADAAAQGAFAELSRRAQEHRPVSTSTAAH